MGDLRDRLDEALYKWEQVCDIPGVDLFGAFVALAQAGKWDFLAALFGAVSPEAGKHAIALKKDYEADPARFCSAFNDLATECKENFLQNSHELLARLSRVNSALRGEPNLAEDVQRLLDSETMLEFAIGQKLITLLDPAVRRARMLREVVVNEASSQDADQYLLEACECFYFGLSSACVVMCRSLLEEALERKLPRQLLADWREEAKQRHLELTLGGLLHKIKQNDVHAISRKFRDLAWQVNGVATRAAHIRPISEVEARDCIRATGSAITILLGGA